MQDRNMSKLNVTVMISERQDSIMAQLSELLVCQSYN